MVARLSLKHVVSFRRPAFGVASLLGLLVHAGCTTASAETSARTDKTPAFSAPKTTDAQNAPVPSAPLAQEQQPKALAKAESGSIFYDLTAHLEDAELRHGESLLIDFGALGDAKYTLGGWGTRMRRGVDVDGVSAALVKGSEGEVIVPVSFSTGGVIEVQTRAPRDGDITVYLDGQVITRAKQDKAAFSTIRLELGPDKLSKGEHMLKLRASGMGKVGAHDTAVAIDWLSVGKAPSGLTSLPNLYATSGVLPLPDGFQAGYTLKVPSTATLSARVETEGNAKLSVLAVSDDLRATVLREGVTTGRFDVDLAALSGKVVRLDFVAQGGTVRVHEARITTDPRQVRAAKPVRNVLVYLIDTLRADHLKPFNKGTRVRTPGLDELVAKGAAVFTSAHTQENWTKPSVATLLSSLFPWEHNAVTTEAVVPSSVQMLPELLQDKGFYTGAFIANGYVSDKFGFKQGWDTYRNYIREGRYSRAEFLAADVLQWLDKRPQKNPFFLYVHAIDPHVPYKPTAEFLSIYDPEPYDGVVNFNGDSALLEKIKIGDIRLNGRDKVRLEALYDSEISYHDVHFRSVMNALEKRGLAEDTMVVVVADHGEEFWDHGSVGHGHSVYEELLRIPMVMHIPGLLTGPVEIDASAGLVDVMPTILDVLGEPMPKDLSGHSLLAELTARGSSKPRVTVSGFMDGWRTAVVSGLKIIQRTPKRVMVHDLASDPHEQKDVSASRPITTRYLRGQLGLALSATEQTEQGGSSRKVHRGEKTKIDKETEAQLEALGYVGTSRR